MAALYKTTIVIWSEDDLDVWELEDLAREAMEGDCYCSKRVSTRIEEPEKDPDWDGTEFFENGYDRYGDEDDDEDDIIYED